MATTPQRFSQGPSASYGRLPTSRKPAGDRFDYLAGMALILGLSCR